MTRIEELEEKCYYTRNHEMYFCYGALSDEELIEYIELQDTWYIPEDHDGRTPYDYLNDRYDELSEIYRDGTDFDNDVWFATAKQIV